MTDNNKIHPKSVKKAKKIFQQDHSLKARADSLLEFLQDSDDKGQLLFLKENHHAAILLIRDYVNHKCLKLIGKCLLFIHIDKYNPGKPIPVKGPETDRLLKCLEVLQKIPILLASEHVADWDALCK